MDRITEKFIEYLKDNDVSNSSIKHYKSDLTNFTAWVIVKNKKSGITIENLSEALPLLNNKLVTEYKDYLTKSNISNKTINRRLSTLRNFSRFLNENNYLDSDIASSVNNIRPKASTKDPIVTNFIKQLKDDNVSQNTIKNYASDLHVFSDWLLLKGMKDIKNAQAQDIKAYMDEALSDSSQATVDRKTSSIKKLFVWTTALGLTKLNPVSEYQKSYATSAKPEGKRGKKTQESQAIGVQRGYRSAQDNLVARFENAPRLQKILAFTFFTRPKWYQAYHTITVTRYIHLAILIIFAATLGYGIYDQLFRTQPQLAQAFPATPVTPNRELSFQGRLTNQLNTPITTATTMKFELYDSAGSGSPPTGGNQLWDSGNCTVTPDQDGIFNVLLGTTSGSGYSCSSAVAIGADVFSENADVWLHATTDGESMDPRIQIATVAYALNSDTLRGYPIDATGSAVASSVVTMNEGGNIVIAEVGPKIRNTSGTFAIEGQALTLSTPDTTNGTITINPDGTGTLDLTFEGAAAGGSAGGFVNATNANITSGALYYGEVNSDATGYDFIQFKSGSGTPAEVFAVDNAGNTSLASGADLSIGGI
ncbi:site-specific integrase, partial [Patescibacteria group bacterium]